MFLSSATSANILSASTSLNHFTAMSETTARCFTLGRFSPARPAASSSRCDLTRGISEIQVSGDSQSPGQPCIWFYTFFRAV